MSEKIVMQKHFVTFYSPGTLFAETTTKPIDSWDVDTAVAMSKDIVERYNARPYGFRFSTHGRGKDDLDSRELKSSRMYYIGGKVETLKEIEARNDPMEEILRSNMRCNGWKKIVRSTSGWAWSQPLERGDTVLPTPTHREAG